MLKLKTQNIEDENDIKTSSNKSFVGNVFKLSSGTAISQVIVLLATPVITRLFSPDEFGVFAIYTAITGIVVVIVCLRYELGIVLARNDIEAANLLWASLFFTILITAITSIIVIYSGNIVVKLINAPGLKPYLWLLPLSIFIQGIFIALSHWITRSKEFGRIATAQVNNSLFASGTKIGSGFLGFTSAGGLILGHIIGFFMSTLFLSLKIFRGDKSVIKKGLDKNKIEKNISDYKRLPLLNGSASLLNMISQKLPAFMLAMFFSTTIVGFYAISYKLLKMPTQLIGKAVQKVYFQEASQSMIQKGNIGNLVNKTLRTLIIISLGPFAIAAVILPDVFGFVFGEQWAEGGMYARWLIPWIFTGFLTVPLSSTISVLNREDIGLWFQSLLLPTRIAAFLVGGMLLKDPLLTIILFSIVGVVYQLFMLGWIIRKSAADNVIRGNVLNTMVLTLFYIIGILIIHLLPLPILLSILVFTVLYIIVYTLFIHKEIRTFYISAIKK